jgi:hypothetical protein
MDRVRRALTRERKTPDLIQDEIDYLGSEAHKRQSRCVFRLALVGLVFAAGLVCLLVLLAPLLGWALTIN